MQNYTPCSILVLRKQVDGGLTNSDICMQIQANIANVPLNRPKMRETTALGTALAAAHAVGTINIFSFKSDSGFNDSGMDCFFSEMDSETRILLRDGWKKAVEKACNWA